MLKNGEAAVDANVAQAVVAEDSESVGDAVGMTVRQDPVDDKVEALVGEAGDRPAEGPVHWDSKADASNAVRKARNEAGRLDMQKGPPGQRQPVLEGS